MTTQFWYSPFLFLTVLSAFSVAQDFDFFYLVLQWPGSFCDTQQGCCYPSSGKPAADFSIHGLWPNYNDGSYPSNCDASNPFDESLAALALKSQANVLQALTSAGIKPSNGQYSLSNTSSAIKEGTDYTAGIECNTDESGNSQLYQVYLCVDTSGASLVDCPVLPNGKCSSQVQFPSL